jgi:hypothetical protein
MQAFPSGATSAAALQCQFGVFFPPTAANSNDPNDLDGDGVTTGDAFCQAGATYVAPPSVVDVTSRKWVRGDDDAEFRAIPGDRLDWHRAGRATSASTDEHGVDVASKPRPVRRLAHIGDTGTSQSGSRRRGAWTAVFDGVDPATVPSGALIEYSAGSTPCRDNWLFLRHRSRQDAPTTGAHRCLPESTAAVRLRITMPSGTLSQLDR